ncbi:restriction endonuclease subunit S [Streptococcus thermophilus]|nr:restriction endonuclease subunit S [Streptococcus thermophilus]
MNTQNKEPNIRFDQFKELWKVVKLDSISQKVKTKNINDAFQNVLTNSAEFGIIPQRDFFDKDIANLKSLNGYYVVQPNDFVYNPRISNKAPVGPIKANFLNSTGVMSPLYYVFRTRNIDVFFLAKYFDSSYWHKFMKLNGDTGARSDRFAIKDSVFKEMPIPFPSHSEQTAIGSLFRTLDDLLASYKDNLANYQSLKATMLSKMFPKAGKTIPEIRLDGFEGEWEVVSLGTLIENYDEIISGASGFPIATSSRKGLYLQNDYFEGGRTGIDLTLDFHRVPMGYVTYRHMSDDSIFKFNKNNFETDVLVSKEYPVFISNDSSDINFLLYHLNNSRLFLRFSTMQKLGGTRVRLYYKNLITYKLAVPTLKEQQAIGAYFSNLDQLITSYQEKITQLETLKKKLLQDMFI